MPLERTRESVSGRLDRARKDLLDLGLRNSLLNYRVPKARGLEVTGPSSVEVFQWLVRDRRALGFQALLGAEEVADGNDLPARQTEAVRSESNGQLPARVTGKSLQARLLATLFLAKAHIEERGVNILFIALGSLRWFEDDNSQKELRAPLLLVPVVLDRTSARDKFKLTYNDEDVEENLSLATKLRTEFRIEYPELPDIEDVDVKGYMNSIRKAVSGMARWRVEENDISLGLFSFGKFLMYRDLEPENWCTEVNPDGKESLAALLKAGFRNDPSPISEDDYLDEKVEPGTLHQVVDIDSSQALAMLDVRGGRHLVIQGPPGTGKSQTITNLLADALGQGKKVLFVAEKLAALEVVKRRLDKVGIGDACLELHSHSANKKAVLAELKRTMELGRPTRPGVDFGLENFVALREQLNEYCRAVNEPVGDSQYTPYQLMGELVGITRRLAGARLPMIGAASRPRLLDRQAISRYETPVRGLQAHLERMGLPSRHPFRHSALQAMLPSDRQQIEAQLESFVGSATRLSAAIRELSSFMGIAVTATAMEGLVLAKAGRRALTAPHLKDVRISTDQWQSQRDAIDELLRTGEQLQSIYTKFESVLIPEAWDADVLEARQVLRSTGQKWWRILSSDYRKTRNRISGLCKGDQPKTVPAQLQLVETIMEAGRLRRIFDERKGIGAELFGVQWQGLKSEWSVLNRINQWVIELYRAIGANEIPRGIVDFLAGNPRLDALGGKVAMVEESLPAVSRDLPALVERLALTERATAAFQGKNLDEQAAIANNWRANLDALPSQITFNNITGALRAAGLEFIVEAATNWEEAGKHLVHFYRYTVLEALLKTAFAEREPLRRFGVGPHEQVRARFAELDRSSILASQLELARKHWSALPKQSGIGQVGVLQREFEKRARHKPIRRLMTEAGNVIQAVKPIFMMSPMSVAAFLPPASVAFDLVIFDEASQVKPVDAFGAILRSDQIVVVGDSKQLPPTSFFDSLVGDDDLEDDDEETTTSDMESILGLMAGQGAPQRMLRWHYRSRHESLIALSNKEFYDSRLVVFPSPIEKRVGLGLVFHHLPDAHYDRGRSRTNRKEAQAVAQAVIQHAKHAPQLTLGVAAFSLVQAEAIFEEVERLRAADPSVEPFFSMHEFEPFFVKNLESVQGDERDVIFISVGYGKDESGYASMNFGALNGNGGERRLNVLITRARRCCQVFSNLTEGDIDLARTPARGVAALKAFLKFAATGILDVPGPGGGDHDSPFEEQVAAAITGAGYEVRAQVGSGGFRIDLGVVDPTQPGRYLLGIECDGASYHSSRSARDRDRLRQEVLEGLGWRIHRIWSTDWFKDGEGELRRLVQAIEGAKAWSPPPAGPVRSIGSPEEQSPPIKRLDREVAPVTELAAKPYATCSVHLALGSLQLHEVSVHQLAPYVQRVVEVESPVHKFEIARRIADGAGVKRIGSRIEAAISGAIQSAARQELVRAKGDFVWSTTGVRAEIRDRSNLPSGSRKIEFVSPEEIAEAVRVVIRASYGIEEQDLIPAVARLFGFGRTSEEINAAIGREMVEMISRGDVESREQHLFLRE